MRRALVLAIVLVPSLARADASLATPTDGRPCDPVHAPHYLMAKEPAMLRLQNAVGLPFAQRGRAHALFGSQWRLEPGGRATVVRLSDEKPLVTVPEGRVALVEEADGTLRGLLAIRDRNQVMTFFDAHGKRLWTSEVGAWGDAADVLVDGDRLVIAQFHRGATGSSLFAVDARTGEVQWKADVEQLNVAHSAYINDVRLSRAGDRLLLEGWEAAGCYQQTFERATGKRLSSRVKRLW